MVFPVIPIIIAAVAGLAVTGTGVAVIDAKKNKAEVKRTADNLLAEVKAHSTTGALYPAFRAARTYIDHVSRNYNLAPEKKEALEKSYDELRNAALSEFRKLKTEYETKAVEAEQDDSGVTLNELRDEYLTSLDKLLGPDAPKLREIENSFGAGYQVHKHGLTAN